MAGSALLDSGPIDADPGRADPQSEPTAPLRRRWPTWLGAFVLAAAMVGVLYFDQSPPVVMAVLFLLVVPFEKLFPRHDQRIRRRGIGTDLAYATLGPLFTAIGIGVAIVVAVFSLAWLPGLAISPIVGQLPGPLTAVAALLLFDATVYWAHRWAHEVPFLWRFHSIHHSPRELDWVSGFRVHPADGALIAPAFIFLVAAGFEPEVAGALTIVQLVTGIFLHANVRWQWRPLQRFVATPEFHHWHHADEPESIHSNYAGFLPLGDMVFGTWYMPKDRRPERYGVSEPIPDGVLAQLRHPLHGLPTVGWALFHPVRGLKLFGRSVASGLRQLRDSTLRPTHTAATETEFILSLTPGPLVSFFRQEVANIAPYYRRLHGWVGGEGARSCCDAKHVALSVCIVVLSPVSYRW